MFIEFKKEKRRKHMNYFGNLDPIYVYMKMIYGTTIYYLIKPENGDNHRTIAISQLSSNVVVLYKADNFPNETNGNYVGYEWTDNSECIECPTTNRNAVHLLRR